MKRIKLVSLILAIAVMTACAANVYAAPLSDYKPSFADSVIDGIGITQAGESGGGVMLEQYALSTQNLSAAKSLIIRYYNPTGAAWPFYLIAQQSGALLNPADGTEYRLYDDSFALVETGTVQYGAVAPAAAAAGYLVIPAAAFGALGTVEALYLTLPAAAPEQIGVTVLHFGWIGYYESETPDFATDYQVLTDFSTWTEAYFAGRATDPAGAALSIVKSTLDKNATLSGMIDGVQITQVGFPGAYAEAGLMINRFDTVEGTFADLKDVTYFAFEYANPSGAQRTALIKMQDAAGTQATIAEKSEITFLDRNFENPRVVSQADPYMRTDTGSGWMIVPRTAFTGLGDTLAACYLLLNAYDASLNGSAIQFGKILTYRGEIADYTAGEVIADPYSWSLTDYTARLATTSQKPVVQMARVQSAPLIEIPIACDFGDVRILEDFSAGYSEDEAEYNAAMAGKIYDKVGGLTVARSASEYGTALKVTVTEPKADRPDDYAGLTFAAKAAVNRWTRWKNDEDSLEGVTLFFSNRSDMKISFSFEIDEFDPDQNLSENPSGERWSVALGARVILYDTVKEQQSLVHATPTVNIPAGFTGWVRIPVSGFTKAAWCTWGNSVLDLTNVPQFTLAFNTQINLGAEFVLDSIGLYYNKTVVKSMFRDNGSSLKDNMEAGK